MNKEQRTMHKVNSKNKNHWTKIIPALFFVLCSLSLSALAGTYDIKQMTPEVQQALSGRQSRYAELQAAKQSGAVVENTEGLVSGNSPLVNAENNDRLVIYQTIADQNGLGSSGLAQIKRAFAETIRERDGR